MFCVIHNEPLTTTPEFYVHEMTYEKPLDKELVARGTKHVTKGLKISSSSLREERRGEEKRGEGRMFE